MNLEMATKKKVRVQRPLLHLAGEENTTIMSIPAELLQEVVGRNHHELIKILREIIASHPSDHPTDYATTSERFGLENRHESDPRNMKLEHLVRDAIRIGREEEGRRLLSLLNKLAA